MAAWCCHAAPCFELVPSASIPDAAGKVVCAVCHGPAGLVLAKDGDKPLVAGKKVTAFTNTEEEAVGKTKVRWAGSFSGWWLVRLGAFHVRSPST